MMTTGAERDARKLVLSGITKKFGGVVALEGVSFSVEPSQIACIVGPSGCGKTTVLNVLAGFETDFSGDARVGDRPIVAPGPDRAVVFQQDALFPWLTVYENVVAGISRQDLRSGVERRAMELLELVHLRDFCDRYPYQLSGGMRQRAAIARALVRRPSVLLLDEPFGALDAQTRQEMQELLQDVCASYAPTLVFITHDIDEALILGDVVFVMSARPGRILETLRVDFARPRGDLIVTTAEFNAMKARIMSQLKSQRRTHSEKENNRAEPTHPAI